MHQAYQRQWVTKLVTWVASKVEEPVATKGHHRPVYSRNSSSAANLDGQDHLKLSPKTMLHWLVLISRLELYRVEKAVIRVVNLRLLVILLKCWSRHQEWLECRLLSKINIRPSKIQCLLAQTTMKMKNFLSIRVPNSGLYKSLNLEMLPHSIVPIWAKSTSNLPTKVSMQVEKQGILITLLS